MADDDDARENSYRQGSGCRNVGVHVCGSNDCDLDMQQDYLTPNVEVTGAARLYRAASVWTAGLCRICTGVFLDCKLNSSWYRFQ